MHVEAEAFRPPSKLKHPQPTTGQVIVDYSRVFNNGGTTSPKAHNLRDLKP